MLEGDVFPPGTICACLAERVSKHRPYMTVCASRPKDPAWLPPSAHVDTKEIPELDQLPNDGVGGV